jgi:monoamine oxidase
MRAASAIDDATIIIGAGAAGLAAAAELTSRGRRINLVEARDRLGGRVFTESSPTSGLPIELGAEFIHGQSDAVFNELRRSGDVAIDAARERWVVTSEGLRRAEGQFVELKRHFGRIEPPLPDVPFEAFLQRHRRTLPPRVRRLARSMVEGFDAADPARISAREVLDEWSGPAAADQPAFRPSGGYFRLLQSIARRLPPDRAEVRFGTVVQAIHWRRGRVDIDATRRGEPLRLSAPRAIVTLPLGVLQLAETSPGFVRFVPELGEKRSALAHLASGPVVKVILTFARPFWAELQSRQYAGAAFFFAPEAPFPTFWTSLPLRTSTLVAWSAGPNAERLAGLSEDRRLESVFESLRTIFGRRDFASMLDSVASHDWQADPYARGAYSYVVAGGAGARKTLAAPVDGTLFFAGEACDAEGEAATVGGALRSGSAAAKQVHASIAGSTSRRRQPARPKQV